MYVSKWEKVKKFELAVIPFYFLHVIPISLSKIDRISDGNSCLVPSPATFKV